MENISKNLDKEIKSIYSEFFKDLKIIDNDNNDIYRPYEERSILLNNKEYSLYTYDWSRISKDELLVVPTFINFSNGIYDSIYYLSCTAFGYSLLVIDFSDDIFTVNDYQFSDIPSNKGECALSKKTSIYSYDRDKFDEMLNNSFLEGFCFNKMFLKQIHYCPLLSREHLVIVRDSDITRYMYCDSVDEIMHSDNYMIIDNDDATLFELSNRVGKSKKKTSR